MLATVAPSFAFQNELAAYNAATIEVCSQGVTSEMQAKYEALVVAVDKAQYGYGRPGSPSNFWGPTRPEMLFEQCHQGSGSSGSGTSD